MNVILDVVLVSTIVASLVKILVDAAKAFGKTIPGRLWNWLKDRLTITIVFQDSDQGFNMVRDWLAEHPYARKAKKVKMQWSPAEGRYVLVPGHGTHYLWFHGPLIIRFVKKETQNRYSGGAEEYHITLFGPNQKKVEEFIEQINQFKAEQKQERMIVYTWSGGDWSYSGPRRKRAMNTVYMPTHTKAAVLKDIGDFINGEEWYHVRGIPYRRGYLFYGPPGTGKTTLATALAGYFDRPIYVMNLASMSSDSTMMSAFTQITNDAIVLIEDVDAFKVTQQRQDHAVRVGSKPQGEAADVDAFAELEDSDGLTLSGILNAIDGVAASEGRILIMTTNHRDNLDEALMRKGRVDKEIKISELGVDEVEQMFMTFYPEDGAPYVSELRAYASNHVQTAANWQDLFIRYHDSVARLVEETLR